MIDFSIIIVNYKTASLVCECLSTIYQFPTVLNFEIIVVDNFSGDDSQHIILNAFPQVRWVQMGYNSGFARANNEGIRQASSEVCLLLNSDTLVKENAINECYARFVQSNHVACGVQLLNLDGSYQISGNYFMKGGLNHLMNLPYLGRLIRAIGLGLKVKKTHVAKAEGEVLVDWINGAYLMFKRQAGKNAGLLDEDFFLFSEEIEWCSRLKKEGSLCIYGDLHVVHLMGETTRKAFNSKAKGYTEWSDRKGLQLMLSGLLRIRKQFGVGWFIFHLLAYLFTVPVSIVFGLLVAPFSNGQSLRSAIGFSGNVMRLLGYTRKILNNRPYFYKVL